MKVGILTYHRSVNYGAYLQALALCKRLNREQDISAEIIDFRMKCDERHYKYSFQTRQPKRILHKIRLNRTFVKSAELLPKSEAYPSSDSLDDFVKYVSGKYDILIAGSDEIWRTDTFRGFPNPYWLPGDLGCIKVAYAASAAKCCFVDMPEADRSQLEAPVKVGYALNMIPHEQNVVDGITGNDFFLYELSDTATIHKEAIDSFIHRMEYYQKLDCSMKEVICLLWKKIKMIMKLH